MRAHVECRPQAAPQRIPRSITPLVSLVVAIAGPLPSVALPTPRTRASVVKLSGHRVDGGANNFNTPSPPTHSHTSWLSLGSSGHGSLLLIAPMGKSNGQIVLPAKVTLRHTPLVCSSSAAVLRTLLQKITFLCFYRFSIVLSLRLRCAVTVLWWLNCEHPLHARTLVNEPNLLAIHAPAPPLLHCVQILQSTQHMVGDMRTVHVD